MNTLKIYRAWILLTITYAVAAIVVGIDKFGIDLIVDWSKYVSPWVISQTPLTIDQFLIAVGSIEIIAGILIWFYPRIGAYILVAWMLLIILNLATMNIFYDIIVRDIIIALGALALAWLSEGLHASPKIVS